MVVAYRIIGYDKKGAAEAMLELERRKVAGEEFDYMSFIEKQIKNKPTPKFSNRESMSILNTLRNIKISK
jgi:hypothetical protein